MTLSEDLIWRGQVKDRTFADDKWLNKPRCFYLGTDCSADSLTIGNLAVYMLARRLVSAGWEAILLVGGATSLIGDPGGKSAERELADKVEIERNVAALSKQVKILLGNTDVKVVNNMDWFKNIGYLDFLRDIGKHYSMTELLQRDFISDRIGDSGRGISYAEFSYSLIQGYDYMYLHKKHNVVLQIGGSDQWGNMLSGVPLIRKKLNTEVHALSMPLVINKFTGAKFGKSEDGAVWLDERKTSVYKFYQFWLNTDDESVEDYLKVYTDLTRKDVELLMSRSRTNPSQRAAQEELAYRVTEIVHGPDRASRIQRLSHAVFSKAPKLDINEQDMSELENEVPTIENALGTDIALTLVTLGLTSSKTEAKKLITSGALYVNGVQVGTDKSVLDEKDFLGKYSLLRLGKNKLAIAKR